MCYCTKKNWRERGSVKKWFCAQEERKKKMKAMPLPFEEFQKKGVLDFFTSSCSSFPDSLLVHQTQPQKWQNKPKQDFSYQNRSALDTARSPSSFSTLSSSQGNGGGGGASTDTTTTGGVAPVLSSNNNNNSGSNNPSVETEKCGQLGAEDWESVLSGSPSQEQSILRLIMGDIEDPSLCLNKLLHNSVGAGGDLEFNTGFGVVDQVLGFDASSNLVSNIDSSSTVTHADFSLLAHNARMNSVLNQATTPNPNPNHLLATSATGFLPGMFQQGAGIEVPEEKPQILNSQVIINQNQAQLSQNPAVLLPLSYTQLQEHHLLSPPPPKRLNSGGNNYSVPRVPFSADLRPDFFLQRNQQQQQQQQNQLQMLQQQRTTAMPMMKQKIGSEELANQQLYQALVNPLCQAAELIDIGNLVLAQGILARLNHQLSLPIGKPCQRAAFYFKEALQLALHTNNSTTTTANSATATTPSSLIFKIGAYKSFSEFSPILQFANFTRNQALLEAFEGFDRIHIVDFDIGCGGQWASLMQELALRNGGAPSLKITAFASSSSHDDIELGFTQENLRFFANDINIPLEIEIMSLESLNSGSWPMPLRVSEKEIIGVNLSVGSFASYPATFPLVIRFVKQLSPKIVVSLDRSCDRIDLPFAHHVNHAIQSYASLLESLDAVNMNLDTLQKIERFVVQPRIEKLVLGRHCFPEKNPPCRSLFLQSGFSPLPFSNFAESQADCLVQRIPVRGFHVEKRQSSLVLCWQRKELVAASAWRC